MSSDITNATLHEAQLGFEELYNKNQTLPRLQEEFSIPEICDHALVNEIPPKFVVDLMAHMVLHKRATMGMLVGMLYRHFMADREGVPENDELQACADAIQRTAEAGLVTWDPSSEKFILLIDVTEDVHENLNRYQYPLPLVVAPLEVKGNRDTGYHSEGSQRGSLILQGGHHEDDICLDHINRVNAVALSINENVVAFVKNSWRDLDRQKEGETHDKYLKRVRAFNKYDASSKDVVDHLLLLGNRFHLTHKYDKRGRCYSQG